MKAILRRHTISFQHALDGIIWALKTQPNFRIHIPLSFLVVALGYWFHITIVEMSFLVVAIVLGLSVEMVNTAIESMTDLITKEYRQEAKVAKDVAAGMMLTTAIGCIVIAVYVFLPYIYAAIK